jgi:hypothetical protein
MRKAVFLALAMCVAAWGAYALDAKFLSSSSWFMSLAPGDREQLRFFALGEADSSRLYLRRFMTPSYFLDVLRGEELKVLLWPEAKRRTLVFAAGGDSFIRETSPSTLSYRRAPGGRGRAAEMGIFPYEGDWEIGKGESVMTASIRACEQRAWALVMYFPGDPESAIPMGYYPLFALSDGTWRSSSAFADSLVELEYDSVSDSLVIRPMFSERPLATDLYDPVHAWRDK